MIALGVWAERWHPGLGGFSFVALPASTRPETVARAARGRQVLIYPVGERWENPDQAWQFLVRVWAELGDPTAGQVLVLEARRPPDRKYRRWFFEVMAQALDYWHPALIACGADPPPQAHGFLCRTPRDIRFCPDRPEVLTLFAASRRRLGRVIGRLLERPTGPAVLILPEAELAGRGLELVSPAGPWVRAMFARIRAEVGSPGQHGRVNRARLCQLLSLLELGLLGVGGGGERR